MKSATKTRRLEWQRTPAGSFIAGERRFYLTKSADQSFWCVYFEGRFISSKTRLVNAKRLAEMVLRAEGMAR